MFKIRISNVYKTLSFQIMISLAWSISLLLCIPQAIIFQGDSCKAHFEGQNSEDYPNWGLKTYIIWFSFSNFFIPLVILFYCYTRICYVIWENGKQRRDFSPVKDESTSKNCFKALTRFAQWDILPYFKKKSSIYSRSVNFRMNFWRHRFSQNMNQKL